MKSHYVPSLNIPEPLPLAELLWHQQGNAMTDANARVCRNGKTGRARLAVVCLAGLLALSGCASFQVSVPDSDPIQPEGQATAYQKKTMHAFFWGVLLDPQVFAAECHGQGINDVVIDRTLAHDLAGVITLGLWMPTDVRFRCKAPPTRPGVLPGPSKRKNMSRRYG